MKIETSLDYFGGVLLGHFPYFSFEVYRANVHDYKIQGSFNFTFNLKFEYMNMVKVDLEVEVVPLLVGLGVSSYQSTAIEDGCFWLHNDW